MAPAVECTAPSGTTADVFVTARWAFVPDISGAAQDQVVARVFTASAVTEPGFDPDVDDPVIEATTDDPDARAITFADALTAGSYWCYVQATDADSVTSAWCATSFTVDPVVLDGSSRPTATVTGRLGCGHHVVRLQDRGGAVVNAEVAFESLNYRRRVDDMTDARVTIGASGLAGERCCLALSNLRAWQHEVAVVRDDVADTWVGVVGDPDYGGGQVTVPARDLFQWMERRDLPHDRTFVATDLAEVFRQYVLDALERDPSPNIDVDMHTSGTTGDRSIEAAAHRRAADELRELARSGVDFTMIGRRMLVGGQELPLPPLPLLTDAMVDDPHLVVRGLDAVSEATVIGATDENSRAPHSGTAGGVDADIGLVQTTTTESSIKDDASCEAAAQSRVDLLSGSAEFVTAVLRPEAAVAFTDLVPGARWPVAIHVECRLVEATFRLAEVEVTVNVGDDGQTEEVKVTLEPLGAVDGA